MNPSNTDYLRLVKSENPDDIKAALEKYTPIIDADPVVRRWRDAMEIELQTFGCIIPANYKKYITEIEKRIDELVLTTKDFDGKEPA